MKLAFGLDSMRGLLSQFLVVGAEIASEMHISVCLVLSLIFPNTATKLQSLSSSGVAGLAVSMPDLNINQPPSSRGCPNSFVLGGPRTIELKRRIIASF